MLRATTLLAFITCALCACGPPTAEASLEVSPSVVDFGKLNTFESAHLGVVVHNKGGATVENLRLELSNTQHSAFRVAPAPTPLSPLNVEPGESIALVVSFQPTNGGLHSSTLRIKTPDETDRGVDVQLIGLAVDSFGPTQDAGTAQPCCLPDAG